LPLAGHLLLLATGVFIRMGVASALVTVAAVAIAFLLLGVHNSWDTVTFVAVNQAKSSKKSDDQ
jgi:predicted histidine transporter YuiF (NhaC family)